jgi:hypothetical protein
MHAQTHARISVAVNLYIPADIIHSLCQLMLTDKVSIFIQPHGKQSFLKVKPWHV